MFPAPPHILPFDFGEETVDSGDPASVTCTVLKGDLPVNITWLHNNRTITKTTDNSIIHGKKFSVLNIEAVSFEHAGKYTCVVNNVAGTAAHTAILNVNGIKIDLCSLTPCLYLAS